MPITYSISQGVTYAETLPSFQAILNVLPDNTQKLIAPRDVRDTIFTTWENIVFKKTSISTSSIEYIGIDQNDLTQKIYFGKKRLQGQEVLTNDLLSGDVDFFFYNTKVEPQDNYNTKIAFLAGTGSFYSGFDLTVPYIESKVVETPIGNYLNFEIRNKSFTFDDLGQPSGGDINILSDFGYVSLNGIIFPKTQTNVNSENDGKYLKFKWDGISGAYATWSSLEVDLNDPVDPNAIYFTDDTPVPVTIGGIAEGRTFSNVPITEVMRELLYPYLKPILSSEFSISVIESGDSISAGLQQLNYSILRKSEFPINSLTLVPSTLQVSSPPLIDPNTITQGGGGVSAFVRPQFSVFLDASTSNLLISTTMTITDTNSSTLTDGASFRIVLPWYYGVSTTATSSVSGINDILGTTTPQSNKLTAILKTSASSTTVTLTTIGLGGQGCIYFGYPSTYTPNIVEIKDQNDFNVTSDFELFTVTGVISPQFRWGGGGENRSYKFYIYTQGTGIPQKTTLSGQFQFKFNF